MLRIFLTACVAAMLWLAGPAAQAQSLQDILQTHADEVAKPGRRSVGVVIDDLVASGLPQAQTFLERWAGREVWQRETDGLFFYAEETSGDTLALTDVDSGEQTTDVPDDDFQQVKPNGRRAPGDRHRAGAVPAVRA